MNKDKNFILLGFTALTSKLAMYYIIFLGANQNLVVDIDIDFIKLFVEDIKDFIFLEKF